MCLIIFISRSSEDQGHFKVKLCLTFYQQVGGRPLTERHSC